MVDLTCPKCLGSLRFTDEGPIATCYDCLGLWVDTRALRDADPPIPKADAVLKAVDAFDLGRARPANMPCPRCNRGDLGTQTVEGVEIDWCFACRGLFLDRGELTRLWEAAGNRLPDPVDLSPALSTVSAQSRGYRVIGIGAALELLGSLLG